MARDAEATRRRLLDAAWDEFAEYGIAGARVDRIAAVAGVNKAQIYHYFGSKDQLFDTVFAELVTATVEQIPFDAYDLPGYAGRLAAGALAHPQALRLATWQRLERAGDEPHPLAVASTHEKITAVAQAQATGAVPDHFPAATLIGLIQHIALFWASAGSEYVAASGGLPDEQARVRAVEDAVRRLLA